jgi:hypothetical protein
MTTPISFNVSFNGYTNFTSSTQAQRVMVLNTNNPQYLRYALLSGDNLQVVYYTASAVIPLASIYQAMFSALPSLTYPPVIGIQPSASVQTITHGAALGTASYYLSASAEIPISYQWYTSPDAGNTWFLPTASVGKYSYKGTSSYGLTASFAVNTQPSWSYECVVSNAAGATTSSTATLYIL